MLSKKQLITAQELKEKIRKKENIFLLDVRQPEEFEEWHIPKSTNIPLASLGNGVLEKIVPKKSLIITICMHGVRSSYAVLELSRNGFSAKSLTGGIEDWKKFGKTKTA